MKIKAPSFADLFAENTPQLGGAKRTKFLQTLDLLIPWEALKALISPYYSSGKRGQQPYPLEIMIHVHFLQLVYNLSDPMCEETLHAGRTHQKLSNEPRYRSPFIGDLTRGTF